MRSSSRAGETAQNGGEFPSEIETVLHGDVHPLAGLGTVGVARITRDEDPREDTGG